MCRLHHLIVLFLFSCVFLSTFRISHAPNDISPRSSSGTASPHAGRLFFYIFMFIRSRHVVCTFFFVSLIFYMYK